MNELSLIPTARRKVKLENRPNIRIKYNKRGLILYMKLQINIMILALNHTNGERMFKIRYLRTMIEI